MNTKKKEVIDFLLSKKFKNINEDEEGIVYENEKLDIGVYLGLKKLSIEISFGYSGDGSYKIKKASLQQLKDVVSTFKVAKFDDFADGKIPKIQFKLTLLNILSNYLKNER